MAWTSSPSSPLALEPAGPADAQGLRELLEACPMPGPVSLVYTRRPDAYRSLLREGEPVEILVVRERACGRVLAMGAFAVRTLWVDGAPTPVAYLFGLRARGDALKRWPVMHHGYARIQDRLAELGIRHAITTIVQSNRRVAAMFARPRRSMPAYRSLGGYDVFALLPARPRTRSKALRLARPADAGRIAAFLNEAGRAQQFFPVIRPDDLLAGRFVPPVGAFRWLEGRPGEVLAAAALWDQSDYRQYRVHGYSRAVASLRTLARIAPILRLPRLPAPGEELRYAALAAWATREHDPTLLADLLDGLAADARPYAFVLAGAHVAHPLHAALQRRRHVRYASEAFRVDWGGDAAPLAPRPLYLECGTL